jgi:hypothetical protein
MTITLTNGKVLSGIKEVVRKTDGTGRVYLSCIYAEAQPSTKVYLVDIERIVV